CYFSRKVTKSSSQTVASLFASVNQLGAPGTTRPGRPGLRQVPPPVTDLLGSIRSLLMAGWG
ncbi:MAG: hypothetical protein WC400_01780, partial [Patescibacteria group bacterium]